MSQVFSPRCSQLSTYESAIILVAVNAEDACVVGHDLGPALIVEVNLADGNVLEFRKGTPNNGDVRFGENDTQLHPTLKAMRLFLNAVKASDTSFISSLVKNRIIRVRIAGDEDGQIT